MKRIRISLDDGDPLHLGVKPMIVLVLGVAVFCFGGADFVLGDTWWKSALLVCTGIAATGLGFRDLVREHVDQAAARETERLKREQEAGV